MRYYILSWRNTSYNRRKQNPPKDLRLSKPHFLPQLHVHVHKASYPIINTGRYCVLDLCTYVSTLLEVFPASRPFLFQRRVMNHVINHQPRPQRQPPDRYHSPVRPPNVCTYILIYYNSSKVGKCLTRGQELKLYSKVRLKFIYHIPLHSF